MRTSLIAVIILATLFNSCKVARDAAAERRVLGNDQSFNKIGNRWQQAHPCTIDTLIQFKDGKEVITYDTIYSSELQYDTINKVEYRTKLVTVTKVIHDTAKIYVTDSRALNTAINDNHLLQGKYDQQTAQLNAEKKSSNKKTWWLIGAGVFILVLGFLIFKLLAYKRK